jgi:hypothetical protein
MHSIIHEHTDGSVHVTSLHLDGKQPNETLDAYLFRMVGHHVESERHFILPTAHVPDVPPERWQVNWTAGTITVLPAPPEILPPAVDLSALPDSVRDIMGHVYTALEALQKQNHDAIAQIRDVQDENATLHERVQELENKNEVAHKILIGG